MGSFTKEAGVSVLEEQRQRQKTGEMAGLSRLVALTRTSRPALNMAVRVLSTSSQLRINEREVAILPGFAKIKEKQKAYAVDDGLRVHEKGGQRDRILYHLSTILVLIGLYEWCRVVWTLAYPDWKTFLSKK